MKILLLGDISGHLDEGMKNTTFYLQHKLSKKHDVLAIHPRVVFSPLQFIKLIRFNPEVVHYLHGPSVRSLFITQLLGGMFRAKTVLSATHPNLGRIGYFLFRLFKPKHVIAQSPQMEQQFRELGCNTHFIPSGVDLERFTPVPTERKKELRRQHGLDEDAFILLHVGPVKKNRNLEPLAKLKSSLEGEIIVAGSTTVKHDPKVLKMLEKAGCQVWLKFFPHVEELYQLADCYVFPVISFNGVIQFPLSVLEAMACGIPVISTKLGGLPRLFREEDGIKFIKDFNKLPQMIEKLNRRVRRPDKINSYSWSNIAAQHSKVYSNYY